ncbi:hypothetical protein GGI42DRAFT_226694 [Trichoderma sp. SZMC 28013]
MTSATARVLCACACSIITVWMNSGYCRHHMYNKPRSQRSLVASKARYYQETQPNTTAGYWWLPRSLSRVLARRRQGCRMNTFQQKAIQVEELHAVSWTTRVRTATKPYIIRAVLVVFALAEGDGEPRQPKLAKANQMGKWWFVEARSKE